MFWSERAREKRENTVTTEHVQEIEPPIIAAFESPSVPEAVSSERLDKPHPRLPQYTAREVQQSIEAIQLLIKVRDRCRAQGLIDW